MELELERELIAFIEMRFDFQVASLCICISYEMLFILFYLFISLGASWGKISGKATEEQQEICIVTKGERWLPSISFVLLHFAEFHMKCISIVVCWGK